MDKVWLGVDAGKEFHWAHLLDSSGTEILSRRVGNDEADLSKLIDEALAFADEVVWAIDQPGGSATLLLGLLWQREQKVLYIPGLTVDRLWIAPATPIVGSQRPMPAMPMSSPIRPV